MKPSEVINRVSNSSVKRSPKLTIKIDGVYFPLEKFKKALDNFYNTLSEIDRETYPENTYSLEWSVAKDFFNNDWITLIGFDRETAEISRYLCRKFRLKSFDALHLSTAVRKQVDYFDTYDKRLENIIKNQSTSGVADFPPNYKKGVILQEPFVHGATGYLF